MPEFFLELFSEEIPARMQRDAADSLAKICTHELQNILPCQSTYKDEHNRVVRQFYGPRRIAIEMQLYDDDAFGTGPFAPERRDDGAAIRGPRIDAPDTALQGFLRKHAAEKSQLVKELGHYILRREPKVSSARELIMTELLPQLTKLSWPKSMRWGQSGDFTWVRPLRRIVCLLDGEVIPFKLGPVTASNETEGHRFLAPGVFSVSSTADWEANLRNHFVIADYATRRQKITHQLIEAAAMLGLTVAHDEQLINEVTGLVEWPVVLTGKIDEKFMTLPPEVRELSMKVNQRYFALRDGDGRPAPYFAFVANIEAKDGGKAIVAGNERVLRARLSDARHFWDMDLKTPLTDLLPKLKKITFHADIGNQFERAERIGLLAQKLASEFENTIGSLPVDDAKHAGLLCKADLVTGMVGEFPELQGIIGGYYAKENGWQRQIPLAIKSHYQPKGPDDEVPSGIVPCAVALADKLDTLIKFFEIGEKPTGSSDPYALRRAALGISRIILENKLSFSLKKFVDDDELFEFIIDRLRTKLRSDGKRYDVLAAVFATGNTKNILHLMFQVEAMSQFLELETGRRLLAAYRRASNILKIEDAKDGPHEGPTDPSLYEEYSERVFAEALESSTEKAVAQINATFYGEAMHELSFLSSFVDDFFLKVTINAELPELRRNRLSLLATFRDSINQIADFSKIEG